MRWIETRWVVCFLEIPCLIPSFTFEKKEQGLIGLQNKKNKRMVLGGKEWGNQNKIKLKLEGPNKDY